MSETAKIKSEMSIKDVLVQIDEILIPLRYLPSRVNLPNKFTVVKITVRRPAYLADPEYYFLVYKNAKGLINVERKLLYYRTKSGRIYSIPISKDDLPKELSAYSRGVHLMIATDPSDKQTVSVLVLPSFEEILSIKGDIEFVNKEQLAISILFNFYPQILSYLNR
jgi:hypothetical protein